MSRRRAFGNDGLVTFAVRMVEVRHPIKLDGLPFMAVRQAMGASFAEPGVSCVNRDLTPLEVTPDPESLPLDADGEFTITYSCTDAGRTASLVRRVKVLPAIELRGDATVLVQKDSSWKDPGARCVDVDAKGLITPVINRIVVTSVADETEVSYTCTDSDAATWTLSRRVIVTSGLPIPVVQGPSAVTLLLGCSEGKWLTILERCNMCQL